MRTVSTVPAMYIEMCTKLPLKTALRDKVGQFVLSPFHHKVSNEDSAYCPSYIEMCTT